MVKSFMKKKKKKESGGNYSSLWDSFPYLDGMGQTVVELDSRSSVAQEALDPAEHSSRNLCC